MVGWCEVVTITAGCWMARMAREQGSFISIMSVPSACWNQPDSIMPDYDQVCQGF
jgi:hypothetical protein